MKLRHVHHRTLDKLICAIINICLAVVLVLVLVLKDIFQVLVLVLVLEIQVLVLVLVVRSLSRSLGVRSLLTSLLNKLTTIFNLTSLDLSCSLRQNKYFSLCRSAMDLFYLLGLLEPCANRAAAVDNLWFFVLAPNTATRGHRYT